MNITIVGAGALGNMLATKLSRNNKVNLIVKKKHTGLIENQEILFKDIDGNIIKSKINIGTDVENCDLIILCVKSYDAQILIQKLSSLDTPILLCQNGLKAMNYALQNIDEKRLSYLVTGNGISKIKTGISEHKGQGFTYLGNLSKSKSNLLKNISKNLYFMMIKHMPNSKIILPKGLMKLSLGIPRVGNMYENVTQNKIVYLKIQMI